MKLQDVLIQYLLPQMVYENIHFATQSHSLFCTWYPLFPFAFPWLLLMLRTFPYVYGPLGILVLCIVYLYHSLADWFVGVIYVVWKLMFCWKHVSCKHFLSVCNFSFNLLWCLLSCKRFYFYVIKIFILLKKFLFSFWVLCVLMKVCLTPWL